MKDPTFILICAQRGSSLGSKTTHWVPLNRDSSINRARRRTGTYLYSSASISAPRRVRAPQITLPILGKLRRQLTPKGFSSPFSASVSLPESSGTPRRVASMPAGPSDPSLAVGASHDPCHCAAGHKFSIRLSLRGLGCFKRGKKRAGFCCVRGYIYPDR